jgi:predicted MFS family arabinose efflux permease
MAWFVQPVFQSIDLPIELFGVSWTVLNLLVGITAAIAYKIERKIGEKFSILIIAIFIPVAFIAISTINGYSSLIILVIFYVLRGFATPVLKDYINRLAESDVRATILSVRSFIIRLNFALIGPFLGWYTDHYTLNQALFLAGVIFLILSLLTMVLFLKSLRPGFQSTLSDKPS